MTRDSADLLRLAAMAAVVLIHASAPAEWRFAHPPSGWDDRLGAFANQLARFCVPLFVALSGYALSARSLARGARPLIATAVDCWRERLLRLALPLIVWSAAYAAWKQPGWGAFLAGLWQGWAEYHLYFLPLLLYASLLHPLLDRCPRTWLLIALGLVSAALSSPAHLIWRAAGVEQPALPTVVPLCWLFWLQLGIWQAHRDARAPQDEPGAGRRLLAAVLLGLAVALLWSEYRYWAARLPDPGWYDHFNRWVVILYGLALWWWWGLQGRWWGRLLARPRLRSLAARLAALSFTVYFIHPAFLRLCADWPIGSFGVFALVLLVSVAAAALIDAAVRPAFLRAGLGLAARR